MNLGPFTPGCFPYVEILIRQKGVRGLRLSYEWIKPSEAASSIARAIEESTELEELGLLWLNRLHQCPTKVGPKLRALEITQLQGGWRIFGLDGHGDGEDDDDEEEDEEERSYDDEFLFAGRFTQLLESGLPSTLESLILETEPISRSTHTTNRFMEVMKTRLSLLLNLHTLHLGRITLPGFTEFLVDHVFSNSENKMRSLSIRDPFYYPGEPRRGFDVIMRMFNANGFLLDSLVLEVDIQPRYVLRDISRAIIQRTRLKMASTSNYTIRFSSQTHWFHVLTFLTSIHRIPRRAPGRVVSQVPWKDLAPRICETLGWDPLSLLSPSS
jgi:hypothetical protein